MYQRKSFFLKNEFQPPTYELSEVSSPALCPVYPSVTAGIDEEKIKDIAKEIAKEIVSDHLYRYHHPHRQEDDHDN